MEEFKSYFRLAWSAGFYFCVAIFSFVFGFIGGIWCVVSLKH